MTEGQQATKDILRANLGEIVGAGDPGLFAEVIDRLHHREPHVSALAGERINVLTEMEGDEDGLTIRFFLVGHESEIVYCAWFCRWEPYEDQQLN